MCSVCPSQKKTTKKRKRKRREKIVLGLSSDTAPPIHYFWCNSCPLIFLQCKGPTVRGQTRVLSIHNTVVLWLWVSKLIIVK